MSRAWVQDLWVKDARVTLSDGTTTRIEPTSAQIRSLGTLPEHFRTSKFGRGSRWRVSWYEGTGQRAKVFRKKSDAEAFAAELEDNIRSGRYIDPSGQDKPFRDVADAWLASKARIKDATWLRYRSDLDRYVLPKWGAKPIGAISRPQIVTWVTELSEGRAPHEFDKGRLEAPRRQAPLAPSTVRQIVRPAFGGVLRYAVREKLIAASPLEHVELPRDEGDIESDLPHLSYGEIEEAANEAREVFGRESDRLLVLLLAYSGPRVGEATALKVKDLDAQGKRVRVMRTWTKDKTDKRKLGPAKTWQKRWVPVPAFIIDGLLGLLGDRGPEAFLFTNTQGGSVNSKNWYTRVWKPVRAGLGLDHITVHDLRHVAATNAIAAGADVKLVQQMLGHKDATETLNTYAHLWPSRMGEVIELIEVRRAEALTTF